MLKTVGWTKRLRDERDIFVFAFSKLSSFLSVFGNNASFSTITSLVHYGTDFHEHTAHSAYRMVLVHCKRWS